MTRTNRNAIAAGKQRKRIIARALLCAHILIATQTAAAAVRDIDGDGRSDMIWYNTTHVAVWKMNGAAAAPLALEAYPRGWSLVGSGDFNGDGRADLLWFGPNRELAVWFSTGNSFTGAMIDIAPPGWGPRAVGDVTGDGRSDILWRYAPTGEIAYWQMNGASLVTGGLTGTRFNSTGDAPLWIRDMNGDGRDDWILYRNGQYVVWTATTNLGTGLTQFIEQPLPSAPGWTLKNLTDIDGDGSSDLIWHSDTFAVGGNPVAFWRMNGATPLGGGLFSPGASVSMSIVAQGDYNGDGRGDLVWAQPNTGTMQMWTSSGNDATVAAMTYPIGWIAFNR